MMFRFHLVCFTFFSVSCIGIWVKGLDLNLVPDHLISCYKNRPPVLPQTMGTLIEIIQKIEIQPTVNMDIRMFTNVLLHKFRVDGIEKDPSVQTMPGVVPFRISGFQAYRQRILLQQLILDNMANFPLNILSETEKCNLHWMLSSTVDAWERGDESIACSSSIQGFMNSPPQRFGAKLSSCPEEWGIVYQEHGTLSPGTVIAGIAAGLAPLQINQSLLLTPSEYGAKPIGWNTYSGSDNSSVDNVFVATLAGDLAEVIQFQAGGVRDIYLGPPGVWNNTYIPTAYYFNNLDYNRIEKKAWQITDAEMTGGIDGLILSKQVPTLENQSRNLRLSQVLDMYYSDRGLFSDSNLRACSREMNIADFINRDKQTFVTQVKAFANVLATKVSTTYHTDESFIESASRQTVDRFTPYLSDSLRKTRCVSRSPHSEKMNLNIIIDQTWTSDMSLQWILFLGRAIDVGYYSSSVSVINGYRGTLITHLSRNTTDIYLNWKSSSTEPYELYLPLSLVTLRATIENAIHRDKFVQRYKSQSHVALIIGYSSTIRDEDHLKAKALVSDIKALNPDMRFVYVTSRVNNYKFVQLTALPGSQNDKIVVLDNVNNVQSFVSQLQDPLSSVPRSLVAPFCTGKRETVDSEYEEYVTPGQPIKYRIHPDYLCGSSKAQIKLINWDYGDIMACVSRSELSSVLVSQCQTLRSNEQYTFSISRPCERPRNKNNEADSKQEWLETCKPIFLDISTQSSSKRCSERECRFPDQVKFNIVLQGLNCVEPFKTICASALIISPSVIVFISVFVVFFVNNLL